MDSVWVPIAIFSALAIVTAAAGVAADSLYGFVWLTLAVAACVGAWLLQRPTGGTWQPWVVGTIAGLGPGIVAGYWAWWWSGFCLFECEGVKNDPLQFVVWFVPLLAVFAALGYLADRAGQYRAVAATEPAGPQ